MSTDDFESRLQRQTPAPIPAEWRGEILRAARRAAAAAAGSERIPWWQAWLWPNPAAWGALAAAWGLVLVLNYSSSATPGAPGAGLVGPVLASQQVRMALAAQRRLEAELLDLSNGLEPAETAPAPTPQPRSERRPVLAAPTLAA